MSTVIRRALLSVFSKDGIVSLGRDLQAAGVEVLSSGGTARLLHENGISVVEVQEYTGFPEMLDGRVKTLHPRIHGGILAIRSNPGHMDALARHGIRPIDLVVVNLYPFTETAARADASFDDVVEMIDIGGPSLLRAAAKNHPDVVVVVDPLDYGVVTQSVRDGEPIAGEIRRRLAAKAFAHTSAYDAAIHAYLAGASGADESRSRFPGRLVLDFGKIQDLRYGENPHQSAAFYREADATGPTVASSAQIQGKELSFNNILDLDAALALASDLREGACVIVKHGNPCGVALGPEPAAAFRRALECDPVSAFGGVIAFSRAVDAPAAEAIVEAFYEGVVAPEVEPAAREILASKKNLRVLVTGGLSTAAPAGWDLRRIRGGLLAQDWDTLGEPVRHGRVVTRRQPSEDDWRALQFAWVVCRHVKSNAIVYARSDRTLGIGAGQMSRVDSARIGIEKAQAPLAGTAMASDAFFPFRDGIDTAAKAGVRAVVQPGGSVRDNEVIAAADEHDMTMVFTGRRHFRH